MRIKKEINIQIGEQIKLAREHAKLTQEAFAERIDVSPQYISDLERGVVGISVPTLKRVCATLCVSSDQILFGNTSLDRASILIEKCRILSDSQFLILSEIAEKFVTAVTTQQNLPKG